MTTLVDAKPFLKKYKISEKDFNETGLKWEQLQAIYNDFVGSKSLFEDFTDSIVKSFQKQKAVHSVRYRVKDPEHLIEKVIRKTIENPKRKITLKNYRTEITDLIGVRVIHLFKSNWITIDRFVRDNWELNEQSIAYVREGDTKTRTKVLSKHGFDIKEHPNGYRSLHYLIKTKPSKNEILVEVQVRTIFEEGWSEIDHKMRYPYEKDNEILNEFLLIFNRLAGSADEMGTFIKSLKSEIKLLESEHKYAIREKDTEIEKLKSKINSLEIAPKDKKGLIKDINQFSGAKYDTSVWKKSYLRTNMADIGLKDIFEQFGEAVEIPKTKK